MVVNVNGGFFSALWGVCCGTAVFPRLLLNSRARAVWHLFLMSLLCTVLLSLRMFPQLRGEWQSFSKRYTEVFGRQMAFSEAGILPEEEHRPRDMPLPDLHFFGKKLPGYLVYTAREKEVKLPAEALSAGKYLVVWNSNFIALAVAVDEQHWDVQLGRPHRSNERRMVDRDQLAAYFTEELNRANSSESWPFPESHEDAEDFFSLAYATYAAVWFAWNLTFTFAAGLLLTGFFAGLARLTGTATARGLTGWQYWQIGVYAGFPGMLIASVIDMLGLSTIKLLDFPVTAYTTVYSLALVIYWLPAALACSDGQRNDNGAPPSA